jgi:hypothetical protein
MARRSKFSGIIIAHLGNIDGANDEQANRFKYVQTALKKGWHVCVNVVFMNGGFVLPHADGFDPVPPAFFSQARVWSRAFDAETLDALCNINAHAFTPAGETGLTLTSCQFVWTSPPHALVPRAIAAFPEIGPENWLDMYEPAGLCSNQPAYYL